MFGITSAPEKYNYLIRDVLRGCEGVANIADDLIIHGPDVKEHDRGLLSVLDRLREGGLTLNAKKCEFRMTRLVFFGHEVTPRGVNPSEEKVAAIQDAIPPKNVSKARSFIGLVQFVARFIPDSSTIGEPIQRLTRQDVEFTWGEEQQRAFLELKRLITKPTTPSLLQGRLPNTSCCRCLTGWTRSSLNPTTRQLVDNYLLRLKESD